jgi:hypothetical protein
MEPETPKPVCTLTGTDGNVFALAGRVARALKQADQHKQAHDMYRRLQQCPSYDAALQLFLEYVDIR